VGGGVGHAVGGLVLGVAFVRCVAGGGTERSEQTGGGRGDLMLGEGLWGRWVVGFVGPGGGKGQRWGGGRVPQVAEGRGASGWRWWGGASGGTGGRRGGGSRGRRIRGGGGM